jgi:hypothetical protein
MIGGEANAYRAVLPSIVLGIRDEGGRLRGGGLPKDQNR